MLAGRFASTTGAFVFIVKLVKLVFISNSPVIAGIAGGIASFDRATPLARKIAGGSAGGITGRDC